MVGLRELLLVAAGGALGSVGRYLTGFLVQRLPGGGSIGGLPIATTVVNLSGSFVIGLVAGLVEFRHLPGEGARLFLVVGVLGGYTTFSAFSLETLALVRAGHGGLALANVGTQVVLGFLAAWAGLLLARP